MEGDEMEGSHSQPLISGCSGAPLSEPPDIRNWFPSYKYETFVLDTCENFGFCISNGTEKCAENCADKEESLGEFRELREIDENKQTGNPNSSKILDSLQSQPLLSEPPDIRNWYSSYVYVSPELHTSDGITNCAFKESEPGQDPQVTRDISKDKLENCGGSPRFINSRELVVSQNGHTSGLVNNDSSVGEEQHGNDSLSEVMVSSRLPSVFSVSVSEPPDIRNWFPDYDSPVLGASDGAADSVCKERESEEEMIPDGENDLEEGPRVARTADATRLTVSDKVDKTEFEKYTWSIVDVEDTEEKEIIIHQAERNENCCGLGSPFWRKSSEQGLDTKALHGSEMNSKEEVYESSLKKVGLLNKLKHNLSSNADSERLETNINTRKCDGRSLEKLKSEVLPGRSSQAEDVCLPSKHVPDSDIAGVALRGTPIQGSGNKERAEIVEDGFISTKKRRILKKTDFENPWRGPDDTLLACSRNKGCNKTDCGNVESVKRKVLAERTNIQCEEAIGVPGKWRCPQKSKPYRGPPMRQVRLEQWVHKV